MRQLISEFWMKIDSSNIPNSYPNNLGGNPIEKVAARIETFSTVFKG